MIRSIQQFQTTGVVNLEKIFVTYASDMKKIAEMVTGVKDVVINLGLSMIAEEWEYYDELLRKRKDLRSKAGSKRWLFLPRIRVNIQEMAILNP